MKIVSKSDAETHETAADPDIILGADWDERARQDDQAEDEIPHEKRGWILLNRSPLARKIMTFNLLALVVLVGGVLYLNQFREGLVGQREKSLVTEARLIARILEARLPQTGSNPASDVVAASRGALSGLDLPRGIKMFIYNNNEDLVAGTSGRLPSEHGARANASSGAPYGTFITGMLNSLWEKAANFLGRRNTEKVVSDKDLATQVVPFALVGKTKSKSVSDPNGDLLFAVSTPIRRGGQVVGALVLTTAAGEINEMARTEREQVLQMFVIAILVSIGLSLVLAGTIANPLRDLAEAAEVGKVKNARRMRPGRIRIPDMTGRPDEIGRLSGALRDMISALYDRIESNEHFAADVAHELKNPLSSLRAAVDTLKSSKNDVHRAKLLSVIEDDVRRMDRLVSDISNASRLDSELVKEEMKSFDLIMMLKNIVAFHEQEATEMGIEFIADLPDRPILVRGLESRLAQVFVNLLTNAISFCEEGDALRIWARRRENRVLVVVEDTGVGIPEDALTKIFQRFYSDRPEGDFGKHSGLGLAISRQIVEAHGGVIWAENIRPTSDDVTSEPLGARFVVGLPI